MELTLLGGLVVLALVDSTSFGTLLIPIWLMLAPGRLRAVRILVFLATVAAFYLCLGVLLTAGVAAFADPIADVLATGPAQLVQLVLGVAMVVVSFRIGRPGRTKGNEPGRLARWRERAVGDEGGVRGLMALAVVAALIEAGSMVPYLAAVGIIGTADLGWAATLLVLLGYCLVMVLPATVLLAGRLLAAARVEPWLRRVNDWMVRNGRENTAWVVGIIGFLLAANALDALGLWSQIDAWSQD